ncbi:hypothetical protein GCM10025779_27790 [Arthrobacter cryoconiti]
MPVLQVVKECLADHDRNGKDRGVAGLSLGDCQTPTLPVNVIKGQRRDFPAAQPTPILGLLGAAR